jgi:hypothetical protein
LLPSIMPSVALSVVTNFLQSVMASNHRPCPC